MDNVPEPEPTVAELLAKDQAAAQAELDDCFKRLDERGYVVTVVQTYVGGQLRDMKCVAVRK